MNVWFNMLYKIYAVEQIYLKRSEINFFVMDFYEIFNLDYFYSIIQFSNISLRIIKQLNRFFIDKGNRDLDETLVSTIIQCNTTVKCFYRIMVKAFLFVLGSGINFYESYHGSTIPPRNLRRNTGFNLLYIRMFLDCLSKMIFVDCFYGFSSLDSL